MGKGKGMRLVIFLISTSELIKFNLVNFANA